MHVMPNMYKQKLTTCTCKLTYKGGGEEKPYKKNQGQEPIHHKYKANENTNRHNQKKRQKQTINKNQVKTLCKDDSWLWDDNQQ